MLIETGNVAILRSPGSNSKNKATACFTSKLVILVAAGLLFSTLLGIDRQVWASELQSPADSALAAFVQQIGGEQPKLIAASDPPRSVDTTYSALINFIQQIEAEQPKLAAAKKSTTDPWAPKSTQPKARIRVTGEATFVGSTACLGCHSSQAAAFSDTVMGRIGKTQKGKFECENCHGPGSLHVKAGGGRDVGEMISYRADDTKRTVAENNAICLTCHERGDRTYWSGSTHETRGVACTSCHTVMKNVSRKSQLKSAFEPDTCFQCHKDRRAQMFRSSHMPLREGKITCSNCHNPHGSTTEALLREASINDNCYKCHAEKRGPFLFEHTPVRENCATCHDAHGSINASMLKIARPRLCAECHSFDHGPGITSGPAARYTFSRSCMNCHTKIHGTNHPAGAILQR
jgi:DmsE family decaheme c-type cytochrome